MDSTFHPSLVSFSTPSYKQLQVTVIDFTPRCRSFRVSLHDVLIEVIQFCKLRILYFTINRWCHFGWIDSKFPRVYGPLFIHLAVCFTHYDYVRHHRDWVGIIWGRILRCGGLLAIGVDNHLPLSYLLPIPASSEGIWFLPIRVVSNSIGNYNYLVVRRNPYGYFRIRFG